MDFVLLATSSLRIFVHLRSIGGDFHPADLRTSIEKDTRESRTDQHRVFSQVLRRATSGCSDRILVESAQHLPPPNTGRRENHLPLRHTPGSRYPLRPTDSTRTQRHIAHSSRVPSQPSSFHCARQRLDYNRHNTLFETSDRRSRPRTPNRSCSGVAQCVSWCGAGAFLARWRGPSHTSGNRRRTRGIVGQFGTRSSACSAVTSSYVPGRPTDSEVCSTSMSPSRSRLVAGLTVTPAASRRVLASLANSERISKTLRVDGSATQ